jgi:hypothetical protein
MQVHQEVKDHKVQKEIQVLKVKPVQLDLLVLQGISDLLVKLDLQDQLELLAQMALLVIQDLQALPGRMVHWVHRVHKDLKVLWVRLVILFKVPRVLLDNQVHLDFLELLEVMDQAVLRVQLEPQVLLEVEAMQELKELRALRETLDQLEHQAPRDKVGHQDPEVNLELRELLVLLVRKVKLDHLEILDHKAIKVPLDLKDRQVVLETLETQVHQDPKEVLAALV